MTDGNTAKVPANTIKTDEAGKAMVRKMRHISENDMMDISFGEEIAEVEDGAVAAEGSVVNGGGGTCADKLWLDGNFDESGEDMALKMISS